jgi:hypothetical protein
MPRKKIEPTEATTQEVMTALYLREHRKAAEALEFALEHLNTKLPARATARQLLTFAAIARAAANGERITISDVRERFGQADDGSEIGANLAKSYLIFVEPSPRDPTALGWVTQQPDAADGRKNYLTLTDAGCLAAKEIFQSMEGAE